jgi:NADH:ubiquinone oxidoreductase subunit F (NADH-binding)/NADH:ubiquinone oxidoreductase subunit E
MDVLHATAAIQRLPTERTKLLDNLGLLRRDVGPITPDLSDALADHMRIRRGEVHEVVSFYSFLQVPTSVYRVCTGPVCDCQGARDLLVGLEGALEVPCLGHCELAPVATSGDTILPGGDDRPVEHTAGDGPALGLGSGDATLADYEARGGMSALRATPGAEEVVAELKAAGLSGFGGAGFPTGLKWESLLREPAPRVLVVNADEGEPGTFKDRYLMELRPHLVLEGALIAMRALDCPEGYIYLREEYATARARLEQAIGELRDAGLLDGLSLELVIGAGAYIAGEETAMLESMEGRRAMPRLKPPFPTQRGHLARPTLINNVETLAHVPAIVRNGGAWWAALGRDGSGGTRLWSVSGSVARPGCYEAPSGITLGDLVELAGGFTEEVGAIVPGGSASGILAPDLLELPLTRDALREHGAGVGSAALQVFPKTYPPARLLAETMRFFAEESCQKCTPCRIGNRALEHLFERLGEGEATMSRARLDEWLLAMEKTSICGLGQASPIPVRNAMKIWPELFAPLDHVQVA